MIEVIVRIVASRYRGDPYCRWGWTLMSVGMVGLVGTGGGVLGESQQGEEPKNKSGSPIR
jgi:hypothetical protein